MKGPITACLLHADYHVMSPACWTATLEWMGAHEHMTEPDQRAAYQAAVEVAILDDYRLSTRPGVVGGDA